MLRWRSPVGLFTLVVTALSLSCAPADRPEEDATPPVPDAGGSSASSVEIGYARGASTATVTVVEFSDFGCRYCGVFARDIYPALHREFVMSGKVQWTYVPFVTGQFRNAEEATRAAECAASRGVAPFWAMHNLIYERQAQWRTTDDPAALFGKWAAELGVPRNFFAECYASEQTGRRIMLANSMASHLGIRATPTFFVNGMRMEGALPLEQFRGVLADAVR